MTNSAGPNSQRSFKKWKKFSIFLSCLWYSSSYWLGHESYIIEGYPSQWSSTSWVRERTGRGIITLNLFCLRMGASPVALRWITTFHCGNKISEKKKKVIRRRTGCNRKREVKINHTFSPFLEEIGDSTAVPEAIRKEKTADFLSFLAGILLHGPPSLLLFPAPPPSPTEEATGPSVATQIGSISSTH